MNPRPRLRPDIVVVEQTFQGEKSFVVKDPASQKYYRFKPVEALVLQQFTGDHTCGEIAAGLTDAGLALSAAAVSGFARKLDRMELFERSVAEKSVMLLERLRADRRRRVKRGAYEGSLLRMRWSVGNPDAMLERWLPRLRFCFTPPFLAASVVLFLVYGVILVWQWGAFGSGLGILFDPATLSFTRVFVIWLTVMAVIAIHELGHGLTCKYFGGQVPEIGAMLLYFQPAFFCNVNDAWTFPELRQRLWVTAAGSWVQLIVAALAAILWLVVDPTSLVAVIALTAVVIGGGMTVLANANPLIPLDGYYALSDYLEIPNLRQRAFGYAAWWVKRHVLRLALPTPVADGRERRVFLVYAGLAALYIGFLFAIIALRVFGFVDRTVGGIGVAALVVAIFAMLRDPARRWWQAMAMTVAEHRKYWREHKVVRTVALACGGIALAGLVIPWPRVVSGEWVSDAARRYALAAPEDAVIARAPIREGTIVPAGAPVITLRSFPLDSEMLVLERAVDSLGAEVRRAMAAQRAGRQGQLQAEQTELSAQRDAARARLQALTLRAPSAAVVATPHAEELVGRKVEAGDIVVELLSADTVQLRIRLQRAGARYVRVGQTVRLLPEADRGAAIRARITEVAARGDSGGAVEARVLLAGNQSAFQPGTTGEAEVIVAHSNIFGAIWWGIRKRIRGDLWL